MKHLSDFINESLDGSHHVFTVIKPGFLDKAGQIIEIFKKHGWQIEKTCTKQLTLGQAKSLYAVHKKEDFYKSLCNYMSSDRSTAIIYKKHKTLMDPFKEVESIKDEIRKKFGESDMRNCLHSSDCAAHMASESSIYF